MFILLAIVLGLLGFILWERRDIYKLSWQLSGPIGLPILGNVLSFTNAHKIISYLDKISKKYESPMRLWLGPQMIVFIFDAENAEIILKSKDCLNKPKRFYKAIVDGLSVDGLLSLPAEQWKLHRRLVSPAVNLSRVREHLPIFNTNIRKAIENLPVNGEFFDILHHFTVCTITMFLEAATGFGLEPEIKKRYLKQFMDGTEIVVNRIMQPLWQIDFLWNKTESAQRLNEYIQFGHALLKNILNERIEKPSDGYSFLERLLAISQENPKFTLDDVLADTLTILTGATDTTSTAAAFTAVLLAIYPEYQEKVFQEILTVMPNKNMDPTQDDLDKLEFLDLCIHEMYRLIPTAPLIARVATKPIKLNNNVDIPPDVPILFGIRQIQTKEKYYGSTANTFDPYRFLDEKLKNLPSAAYMPFSYGARDCAGYFYAKVAVKCIVVYLVRNYRLTTIYANIDELRLFSHINMRLIDKHMIKLERRE